MANTPLAGKEIVESMRLTDHFLITTAEGKNRRISRDSLGLSFEEIPIVMQAYTNAKGELILVMGDAADLNPVAISTQSVEVKSAAKTISGGPVSTEGVLATEDEAVTYVSAVIFAAKNLGSYTLETSQKLGGIGTVSTISMEVDET